MARNLGTTRAARWTGAALMVLSIAPWALVGTAGATVTGEIELKASQRGMTAAEFGGHACSGFDRTKGDGFHFVITGDGRVFDSLTAVFDTGSVTITDFGPPTDKHAYVYAPVGATLLDAWANTTPDPDAKTQFVLSSTCSGETTETSSPPATTPPETTPVTTTPVTTTPVTTTPPLTTPPETTPVTTTPVTTTPVTTTPPLTTPPETTTPVTTTPVTTSPPETLITTTGPETVPASSSVSPSVLGTKTGLPQTGSGLPVGKALALSLALMLAGLALLALPGHVGLEYNRRH